MLMQKPRKGDRHDPNKTAIQVRVERPLRQLLEAEVRQSGLPKWTLSDHIRYDLLKKRGLWKEPYEPAHKAPHRAK